MEYIKLEKIIRFLKMYKMYTFNIKTWIDNGVEAIKYDQKIWISKTQFGYCIGYSNRASVIQY